MTRLDVRWPVSIETFRSVAGALVERTVLEAPVLGNVTKPIYWQVAPYAYQRLYPTDFEDTAIAPDPFKIVRIDPQRVQRFTRRWYPPWRRRRALFGAVMDGDWDRRPHAAAPIHGGPPEELFHAERIEEGLLYRAMEARFTEDVPWRETPFVQRAIEYIEDGRSPVWHDCSSASDVLERCRFLEKVHRSMEREGCRSYRERTSSVERDVDFLGGLEREIVVDIGRDGELLLVSGKHRLCLSRIIGLDNVPVCFLVRHAEWMDTRRAVADGDKAKPGHPDLRDIR